MLSDARDIEKGKTIHTDVCVVGAGAAGITIARELIGSRISVCLLESGGLKFEPDTQSLYEGDSTGTLLPSGSHYPARSRLRAFGGSTNHWAGWCRPLDDIDFEVRPWIHDSGWPFRKEQLDLFYDRACEVCQIPPFNYNSATLAGLNRTPVLVGNGSRISTQIFHQSPPTRFGATYGYEITSARNTTLILHANVVDMVAEPKGSRLKQVEVATLGGNRFFVKAKRFVLATGGLENARLLLLSSSVQRNGLGNNHDQVGRYFMDHPHVPVGRICLWKPKQAWALYSGSSYDSTVKARTIGIYRLNDEVQRRLGLLNAGFSLIPLDGPLSDTKRAYKYFNLSQTFFLQPGGNPPTPPSKEDQKYQEYLKQTRLFESVAYLSHDVDALFHAESDIGKPDDRAFLGILFARTEQAPNSHSRITLATERDPLGKSRLRLAWNLSSPDKDSILQSAKFFALELGSAGLGRLQLFGDDLSAWPIAGGGSHHMGTTRMHDDPKKGVVDRDCRVHGMDNLFIAGSSVFPTSGYANPTLTLVALAIKLAGHLKEALRA